MQSQFNLKRNALIAIATAYLIVPLLAALSLVAPAAALPTQVVHADDPLKCDPLFVPPNVHELGLGMGPHFDFPPDEEIAASAATTSTDPRRFGISAIPGLF